MRVEINISRLNYLLSLYKLSADDLIDILNKDRKVQIEKEDLFSSEIKFSYLKLIDKIFNKGLHFYLDPKAPDLSKEASIFFRKKDFAVELNLAAKKVVNQFEEFKLSLSAISKLADLKQDRVLPTFKTSNDPSEVAFFVRTLIYPEFNSSPKEFLKLLISKLAEYNILVFEFIETWNKKEQANIDGFFLDPNVIVLKRNQLSFRREIFTLVHELGHYLLKVEEIEKIDYETQISSLNVVEKWCNDFAYFFLVKEYDDILSSIQNVDASNDYYHEEIQNISNYTHLSRTALYTRLLFQKKISIKTYRQIRKDFEVQFAQRQEALANQREKSKLEGIKQGGSTPKPINSPLLVSTIQAAFQGGVINEYEVCKALKIKPEKLYKYI